MVLVLLTFKIVLFVRGEGTESMQKNPHCIQPVSNLGTSVTYITRSPCLNMVQKGICIPQSFTLIYASFLSSHHVLNTSCCSSCGCSVFCLAWH